MKPARQRHRHSGKRGNEYLCLNELDGDWGDAPSNATGLIERCYAYRRIQLRNLTVEHFRTLILQNISLEFLIPVALPLLEKNPFAEGLCYPGDLLHAVLMADLQYWSSHPAERAGMLAVIAKAKAQSETFEESDRATWSETLRKACGRLAC